MAFLLATAALAATGAAVYVSAVSRHAPNPAGHAALSVIVCFSFVGAGLVAVRRPPYVRFGLVLVAVGFSALLGALHDANTPVPYTIGVLTANLVFAVLVYALLAFPRGRLGSRSSRILALIVFVDVLALQALAVVFDPLTRWHSDHPRNAVLIDSHATLATVLEELEGVVAIAIAIFVALMLFRSIRAKTPVARRLFLPVAVGGTVALVLLAIGLVLAPLSSNAAVVGIGLGLLASLALPAAFLGVLLQGRLSRAAVGELLVELREGTKAPGLEDALQRALGDPSLELARRGDHGDYLDGEGRPVELPSPRGPRVATSIEHQGEPVGMLVHDRSLRMRPELLDAVSAAAGFAIANERALETVQRVEGSNRALLGAIPDLMIRVARDGTYLDVRSEDPAQLLRPAEELVGRNVRDVLPAELADRVLACIERALSTGTMSSIEYEIEIAGTLRWKESRMVPSGDDEVVTIVRDFTDQRAAEAARRRLGDEQAALRRVATLVAGDPPPERVFQAVTEEVCLLLGIREALLERYEDPDTVTIVGRFGTPLDAFAIGTSVRLEEGMAAWRVLRKGGPVHVEGYDNFRGEVAVRFRELGFSSTVAVPIEVAGGIWGALIVALRPDEVLPAEIERRLQEFAKLVGVAVASAQAREELAASRLRIVEASDSERRRLERNLHDGAQQRLVALSVALRLAQAKIPQAPEEAEKLLSDAATDLSEALTELRELAQGIHPALLTERGLCSAIEVLAARTPLPVRLDLQLPDERLPEPIEAAAYYVVSEALANVVKHAGAESAAVRVVRANGSTFVEIEDNGGGGASLDAGSGLCGLRDRVETLRGMLEVESIRGQGTVVRAELPLR